ncbi:SIMPL domain-containing protein [Sphaerisporangium rubeum]|uniref:DUF541 domain-containing protein n=1 Tax=Sphaerisporangium rubeum TaxID=321317 RepID=A0A7X0IGL7_9ACTN|nr:SIMPL domain-containing protein [Sphaerisporangium rubeum]MBB6474670.1 hypothetical protein [Sphaerisporangium rubeum]
MTKLSVLLAAAAFAAAGLQAAPVLAAASPVPGPAAAYEPASKPGGDPVTITIEGQGGVPVTPDSMRLNVAVEVRKDTAGEAFAAARAAAGRLTAVLLDAGVAEKDLRTNDLSLDAEYDKSKVVAYRASQGVQAIVRDLSTADAVVDAAAAVGDEIRFRGISFVVSKAGELLKKARDAAFEDARSKAEQYAGLAGYELGRVLRIEEEDGGGSSRFAFAAAPDGGASIEPGTSSVTATVRLLYELVEAGAGR